MTRRQAKHIATQLTRQTGSVHIVKFGGYDRFGKSRWWVKRIDVQRASEAAA